MIYYPLPLHRQKAYACDGTGLKIAESLADSVLSLPMHTELTPVIQERIAGEVAGFFKR